MVVLKVTGSPLLFQFSPTEIKFLSYKSHCFSQSTRQWVFLYIHSIVQLSSLILEHFPIAPKETPSLSAVSPSSRPPARGFFESVFCLSSCLFWTFHVNGITRSDVTLCSVLRLLRAVLCVRAPFPGGG